LKSYQSLGQ